MRRGIDRRSLLRGIGGSAALGAFAPALLAGGGCGAGGALEATLAACIADAAAARAVGEEVLATSFPHPPSASRLVAQLAGAERDEWETLAATDPRRLFDAVCARHRADFAAQRVRKVRGWVLSETEARLAALVARRAQRAA